MSNERATIVEWLRGQCHDPMLPDFAEFLRAYADAIEGGEHMPPNENAGR